MYFRLRRYDKVWLLSLVISECSLSILWLPSECFLSALSALRMFALCPLSHDKESEAERWRLRALDNFVPYRQTNRQRQSDSLSSCRSQQKSDKKLNILSYPLLKECRYCLGPSRPCRQACWSNNLSCLSLLIVSVTVSSFFQYTFTLVSSFIH